MLRILPGEKFARFIPEDPLVYGYSISNYGRLVRFKEGFEIDAVILKGGISEGYRTYVYRTKKSGVDRSKSLMLYKLVANAIVKKNADDQQHIIHLDYDRGNDTFNNLKWVTRPEMLDHEQKSPKVIEARKNIPPIESRKLNTTQVIHLKKLLKDPKRKTRVKILAKQFNISEMQVFRIKRGENWGHVEVS